MSGWHLIGSTPRDGALVALALPASVEAWRAMLGALAAEVEAVALVRTARLEEGALGLAASMLALLDEEQSVVVRAVPIMDAVKRLSGVHIVGSVDRSELFGLEEPLAARREVLGAALAALPDLPVAKDEPVVAGIPLRLFRDGVVAVRMTVGRSEPLGRIET